MRLKQRVDNLLGADQNLRNSDKKLLLAYWEQQGLYLSESQRATFMRCATAESITRARRGLRWKYPGNETVEAERRHKEAMYQHNENPRAVPWLNDEEEL